jgi:hypothetical protein
MLSARLSMSTAASATSTPQWEHVASPEVTGCPHFGHGALRSTAGRAEDGKGSSGDGIRYLRFSRGIGCTRIVLEGADEVGAFSTPSLKNATAPEIPPFLGKNGGNTP